MAQASACEGALLFLAIVACAAPVLGAAAIREDFNVRVRMRDGIVLSTNVFRPAADAKLPTILLRTPYGKGRALTPHLRAFVEHGFAMVVQDVRGRFGSGGVFDPLRQETADGDDTLNWIGAQPWSNGRIGMMGGSYLGIVQWKAALAGNPYLKAIFPAVSGCDDYFDRFYSSGGAMKLGQRLDWMSQNLRQPGTARPDFNKFVLHLPLRSSDAAAVTRTIGFYQAALDHPSYDEYWKSLSTRERLAGVRVPVFSSGGWFDNFVESDLEAFRILRGSGRLHRAVIGPWTHGGSTQFPGVDFGPDARVPFRQLQFEWFDHWLKDGGANSPSIGNPPLRIFVMGANRWRDEEEWPLRRARATPFYLGDRGALTLSRPRRSAPDRFLYDPRNPVPTSGGAACCNPKLIPAGPADQREIEGRPDVLVYTTAPLERDLEVTGPVRAILFVSTSARDTDFTAKLVDVYPDGRAMALTDGILRLRYRESLEKPVLAHPGEAYRISIDAGVTSNLFRKGHRIRLQVSSSNFPRFDRNPNTGRPVADETELRRAEQTVYHDRARASHLLLPVVP